MDRDLHESFLSLVRLGIGHNTTDPIKAVVWSALQALAERQGLAAIIVDGIERMPEAQRPPKEELLQMIGQVVQGYEYRYELYRRAIAELAAFYKEHNLKMMILKGYACGLDWPEPEHRPYGDIDIWLFGKQKEGDALLESEKQIKVDDSHHHHTVFYWKDFMVENHYDFINVYAHKSNAELEKLFKMLGSDDSNYIEEYGERLYLPSPNLLALFLVKHMASHFASSEISLRQVLDWAFFVNKHTNEIEWKWLTGELEKYGMKEFFNLINAICVDDLGFSGALFPEIRYLPDLKDKVLNDIIEPAFATAEPKNIFSRFLYKFRRWKGNSWKHDLCYNESRWSAFWYGVRNHMIKPS